MLKFVMLVKLAFAMKRLTKHLKNFCHDQQRSPGGGNFLILWGGTQLLSGGHRAHGNRDSLSFSP